MSPSPSTRLLLFQSTWLDQHAVRRRGALRFEFTPLLAGPGQCAPSRSRPAYYLTKKLHFTVGSFLTLSCQWFDRAGATASVTLLRPSLGTSADIAVRHRIKPQRRGCVSRARSTGVALGPLVKKKTKTKQNQNIFVMGTCFN